MLLIENFQNARRALILAHTRHFGMVDHQMPEEKTESLEMDLVLSYLNHHDNVLPKPPAETPSETQDPVVPGTYKVEVMYFEERNAAPNSLTFPIPPGPPGDQRAPVQCTKTDCPIRRYHYEGLYMECGVPCEKDSLFGLSDPPLEIWQAVELIRDGKEKDEHMKMVDNFDVYHSCR